jgi:signal transduction histidine kinase
LTTHTHPKRRPLILFTVPLLFSVLFFSVTSLAEHTDTALSRIQDLFSGVVQLRLLVSEVEAGERGFLLTGDGQYLRHLQQADHSLQTQTETYLRYAADQPPGIRDEISHLGLLARQRAQLARTVVEAKQSGARDPALIAAESSASERVMDQVRASMDSLRKQLKDEESGYLRRQFRLNHLAFLAFIVGTIGVIAVMLRLYRTAMSYLAGRDALELQLKNLNLNLEAQVDERTRDLKLANEELQQFAYVASHDLQEPLRTITSFSQLLEARYKGKLDEDADEFIGYVVTSARRMTDLINGLLALARLRKAGQLTTPVSFHELLLETEGSLRGAIRDSGAQIMYGDLPSLVVDRVQFLQVLQNLISNAIKYRRDEPLMIRVSAQRTATHWIFAVEDNGRGFDPQFSERIFGLFQRLHGKEVAQGTGMGLSIARKIVERHGGRIWAESAEGKGSTFFFSLPVSLETSRLAELNQDAKAFAQAQ